MPEQTHAQPRRIGDAIDDILSNRGKGKELVMILGVSTSTFTLLHVLISVVALVSGAVAIGGMAIGRRLDGWTPLFLWSTVATSVTGFLFHSKSFGPPHIIGVISLVVLAFTFTALYFYRMVGLWRPVYVVTAITALYLNAFVAVVQAFQKISLLHDLAPTQSEPPFLVAQALLLVGFIIVGLLSTWKFRPSKQLA
jgi:hypothetical protein